MELLNQNKYAIAVALIGIALMLLPGRSEPKIETPAAVQAEVTLEQLLEDTLSQIQGAGKVKVLLTQRKGKQIHYQTDTDSTSDTDSGSARVKTVIVSDTDRNETGLVHRTDPPEYLGAVIVCQGAQDARVRLAIVQAVSCATGLGSNQISVLKMK